MTSEGKSIIERREIFVHARHLNFNEIQIHTLDIIIVVLNENDFTQIIIVSIKPQKEVNLMWKSLF